MSHVKLLIIKFISTFLNLSTQLQNCSCSVLVKQSILLFNSACFPSPVSPIYFLPPHAYFRATFHSPIFFSVLYSDTVVCNVAIEAVQCRYHLSHFSTLFLSFLSTVSFLTYFFTVVFVCPNSIPSTICGKYPHISYLWTVYHTLFLLYSTNKYDHSMSNLASSDSFFFSITHPIFFLA